MRPGTSIAAVAVALASACTVASCGGSYARTEGHYCTSVHTHLGQLQGAAVTTPAEVSSMLRAWRAVSATAPLQIQPEWDTVVVALEAAVRVDLTAPDAVQTMAATVRGATPAANRVIAYTYKKCGELIGKVKPVATSIPPQVFPPVTS
jgi:hypothetical protein